MATMNDVARLAGVSASTVSYALTGVRPVSEATRERVRVAMDQLGYRPNALARGLASNRTRILALLFPAIERGLGGTALEFVTAAAETAREHGCHLVLWPTGDDEVGETHELVHQGLVDGLVVMEVKLDDPRVDLLRSTATPFTLIGRTARPDGLPYCDIDFELTVRGALDHLSGLGHEHIALLSHSEASLAAGYGPTVRVQKAFEQQTSERGLPALVRHCDESADAGRAVAADLFRTHPEVTALVTMNDDATFGAVAEIVEGGRDVPGEVSVLSVVSSPRVGALSHPRLTTMAAPGAELGRLGVESVITRVEQGDSPVVRELIPCRLDAQATTGPAPGTHAHTPPGTP
ncbi:LacI family transcriptional regulator [Haloactinopolyspora alba]|uniref:LacI family transcriptional regulator n=2 Tax=Haloactinopolyspora alba TaxID=648780 RepID=A0A2P8DNB8_9ACTN|nr:LacI family transcriptional regulator [Haloactinopolyspora alba]